MKISEALREQIRECGLSANALAKEVLIPQPTITRFLNGAELKISTADKLAAYFGLQLVAGAPAKAAGKTTKKAKR